MKQCPFCGYEDPMDSAKFCTMCGGAYPPPAETPGQPPEAAAEKPPEQGDLFSAYYQQMMAEKKDSPHFGRMFVFLFFGALVLVIIGFLLS